MADEPKLIVALEARLDRFEKDLKQAGVIAQREIGNIESKSGRGLERVANAGSIAFNRMGASILGVSTRMVGALGPIAAVAAAVAALGVSANQLGKIVKDLRDIGEAAQVPADTVQALQHAMVALGGDAKDAGAILKTFDAQMTLLRRGQGDLFTTLQRVNPALIAQLSATKNQTAAVDVLVASYGDLNEEGKRLVTQAAAGALDQQLRKFLATGKGLGQLTADLRGSGRAIDEATGTKLIELNNQISAATQNIKDNLLVALTNLGGIQVLNAIARTAEAIANITAGIRAFKMTTEGEPLRITVNKPQQDVTPRLPTAAEQLATLKPIVEFLGEAATRSQLFAVAQLQLKAAMEANQTLAPQYKRALEGITVAQNAQTVAARQAAGIATEQEIVQQRLADAYLKRNTGIIQSDAELVAAEAKIRKEAREFLQQQEAAASRLPNITKTLQDLGTISKQLDAIGLRSADHFADGILAIADGSKKAKDAFADMAKSILNDIAKLAVRRVFLQGFSSAFGGGPVTPGLAAGGPAQAGQPYIVGERGPEVFVPNQSGTVVPNSAVRRGGGTTFAPVTNIDARGSTMDESQFRQILAANNRALLQQFDRGLPARQQRMALLGT